MQKKNRKAEAAVAIVVSQQHKPKTPVLHHFLSFPNVYLPVFLYDFLGPVLVLPAFMSQ